MKKILSAILCLLVCAQAFGVGAISAEAEETKEMFFDSFDYKAFGSSGLYGGNNAWEREYSTPKDGMTRARPTVPRLFRPVVF